MAAYLTATELAERWSCSASHVRRLARRGELRGMRLGTDWRFPMDSVEAFEIHHANEPESAPELALPRKQEVRPPAAIDGFTLPKGYVPVYPELWTGYEPPTKKTAHSG